MHLHFTATGEFLTQMSRTLWADDCQMSKAVRLLTDGLVGMTEDQAVKVITGQCKLVGDSTIGINMIDEEPKATHSAAGNSLTMADVLARLEKRLRDTDDELFDATHWTYMVSPKGLVRIGYRRACRLVAANASGEEILQNAEAITNVGHPEYPLAAREVCHRIHGVNDALGVYGPSSLDSKDPPELLVTALAKAIDVGMLKVASAIEDAIDDKRIVAGAIDWDAGVEEPEQDLPPPVEDTTLASLNGWVDPEGRLYPCEYQGHLALADRLVECGKASPDPMENAGHALEAQGWLKISDSQDHAHWLPADECSQDVFPSDNFHGEYTQTQKNTIWDWCKKHGRRFPVFLRGNEEEQ